MWDGITDTIGVIAGAVPAGSGCLLVTIGKKKKPKNNPMPYYF